MLNADKSDSAGVYKGRVEKTDIFCYLLPKYAWPLKPALVHSSCLLHTYVCSNWPLHTPTQYLFLTDSPAEPANWELGKTPLPRTFSVLLNRYPGWCLILPTYLLAFWFLAWLIFNPEGGHDTFFWNVTSYMDYTALYPRRWKLS
jgi:hypothetical protein